MYFKTNVSVTFTQRIFYWHFSIHRNDSVASRNTLLLWVRNVRETASAAKRKPTQRKPAVRIPENIKRLCKIFVGSPRRSESRNALALRMSGRTVRWILHSDVNSHPYKMFIFKHSIIKTLRIEELFVRILWKLKVTTKITILSWQMKQIFIFLATSILRFDDAVQLRTRSRCLSGNFTFWKCCVRCCVASIGLIDS